MKITVLQLNIAWCDKERNFDNVRKLTKKLNTDIIVLPEIFATGVVKKCAGEYAESSNGLTTKFLRELAKQKKAFVLGTYAGKSGKKPKNVMAVFDKNGKIKCR